MAIGGIFRLISLLAYIFLIISPMALSISDIQALLDLKKSFTNTKALNSWEPGSEPCAKSNEWAGIVCFNGIITGLRLGQMGLSGKIDIDALVLIPELRTLSFVKNEFSGPIPDFYKMGALKAIYLSGNQFSGQIRSDYFTKMESLKKIWLSENNFTGEIPSSLANLPHLIELHLENNQFSGAIPSIAQTTLVSLNVSNNRLEGEIPTSLSKFGSSSFEGNSGVCGAQFGRSCDHVAEKNPVEPTTNNGNDEKNKSDNRKMATGLMTAVVVILSLMVVIILVWRKRQEKFNMLAKDYFDGAVEVRVSSASKKDIDSSSKKGTGSSRRGSSHGKGVADLVLVNEDKGAFGLPDLMKAAAEVLGNGALGSSYKAVIANGTTLVVKRIKEMSKMGKDGFDTEIRRFGRLRHWNIMTPLAYHYRKEEKLLIYEYIPKGSLLYLLHGERGMSHAELNWPARLKIIKGIARGLGYLHTERANSDLPHGNLKSSNVLLAPDYEPLLTDYGFDDLTTTNQASQALFAYKSPESSQSRLVSPKCDVYCLGIIILEVLTRKFPTQYLNNGKGGTDVVQWVKSAILERREAEFLDPDITSCKNYIGEMERLLQIGADCTENNPEKRIDVREAIKRIEEIQIEGGQEGRTIQLVPSLRDGYGESIPVQSHEASVRQGSFGDVPGLRSKDSFAFDIS